MKKNEVAPLKLGQKVSSVPQKNYKDPKNWPSSLQEFITRCFTKSNELNFNKELKDQFQLQLKKIIDKAITENKVELNDWTQQKLPIFDYSFKRLELMCDLSPVPVNSGRISLKIPKQKPVQVHPNPAFSLPARPTVSETLSPVVKPVKKQPRNEPFPKKQESVTKKQRLQRFQNLERASPTPEPVDDGRPLVGTCQNLEKNYLRLTSAPIPELVRPLPVLKKTLKLLRSKFEKEKDYNYLKNQLKSLRQDITVQHIKNKFTVKAYEFHSKIAIEFKDLGEFNQCQSQLKQLYQLKFNTPHTNKYEFLGYRILYFIITKDHTEIMNLKLSLLDSDPQLLQNEFILLALKFWNYTLTNNYHDFFQLYSNLIEIDKAAFDKGEVNDDDDEVSMNNLNNSKFYYFLKMIKDFIIERQLLTTFAVLSKAYKKLSKTFIITEFFLKNESEFSSFLEEKNLLQYVEGDFFEFAKARHDIQQHVSVNRTVDIKGQI